MDRPNWDCTCPKFTFSRTCRHVQELWNEIGGFNQASVVHHDELVDKPWYKPT
jgi:hypothetical protein